MKAWNKIILPDLRLLLFVWFQTSATVYMGFMGFSLFFPCLICEDETDKLSRNVGNFQTTLRNMPEERRYNCCLFIVFCICTTYLQQQADVRTRLTLQFTGTIYVGN